MATISLMDDELFRAAVKGDLSFLSKDTIDKHGVLYYTEQTTPKRNNILHIAAEHGRAEFLEQAVAQFPDLCSRKNNNLDTPLHIAAMKGNEKIVKLLVSFQGCATATMDEVKEGENWTWLAKNKQGDTPLHLALSNNKLNVVMDLLEVGSTLALSSVNAAQETPLHVFLKYCIGTYTTMDALLEEGVLNMQGEYKCDQGHMSTQSCSSLEVVRDVLTELLKYKLATCMADEDGLTPLLIAAQKGSFMAMRLILDSCPQSAEVSDPQGQILLHLLKRPTLISSQENHGAQDRGFGDPETHSAESPPSTYYWELKKLLNVPEVNAIKDAKDSLGNTSAHMAVESRDFVLVRVLFECFADLTIKNRDGVSALDLIKSFPDFATKMAEITRTEKVLLSKMLKPELVQAIRKGDTSLFQRIEVDIESGEVKYPTGYDRECFLARSHGGLNILHIAVRFEQVSVVEEIMKYFPTLVLTADSNGETPLHFGARNGKEFYPVTRTLLNLTKEAINKFKAEGRPMFLETLPWRLKNSKGDTPLHEALRFSNYDMAFDLLDIDSSLSLLENRAGETPLHILARYGTYTKSDKIRLSVKRLLGQNESAVFRSDAQGFTPLLRAAYCGRIRVAYWIVFHCPSSVQFQDGSGRTFLHLLRLEPTAELDFVTIEDMLYTYREVLSFHKQSSLNALRISQDHDGNTPLHFALKSNNLPAAKFLLLECIERRARNEMGIIDNDGRSVPDLLESLADDLPYAKELKDLGLRAQRKIKDEAFGKKMMSSTVYMAAVKGDMNLLDDWMNSPAPSIFRSPTILGGNTDKDSKFTDSEIELLENEIAPDGRSNFLHMVLKQNSNAIDGGAESDVNDSKLSGSDIEFWEKQIAPDGSNVLHIALQHGQIEFAKEVVKWHPHLICERNSMGDTPLHIAAKHWNVSLPLSYFTDAWSKVNVYNLYVIPPWRVKNWKGNTPLHEAVKSKNLVSLRLMKLDSIVTTYVNHAGETPLHLATDQAYGIKVLLRRNKSAAYTPDRDGLTPLLRASKNGDTAVAQEILKQCPESIQLKDDQGKSFLHLLRPHKDDVLESYVKQLYRMPQVDSLRKTVDSDGNTPLHSAILDGNSAGAKLLVNQFIKDGKGTGKQVEARNDQGKTVLDLLATHDDAPTEVMQLLNKMVDTNINGLYIIGGWVRSSHGICKSQIKDMANTLSVVAGLLATITFAAAFQVPGGFNGDSGNPVLLTRIAFKVFMISNTFAMCGSMIVLFSLLWVMFAGTVANSFLLLDLAIVILQLSLGATLMSFMTGVYATTAPGALALGIFACAFCTTTIVLMRKGFILGITRFVRLLLYYYVFCKVWAYECRSSCSKRIDALFKRGAGEIDAQQSDSDELEFLSPIRPIHQTLSTISPIHPPIRREFTKPKSRFGEPPFEMEETIGSPRSIPTEVEIVIPVNQDKRSDRTESFTKPKSRFREPSIPFSEVIEENIESQQSDLGEVEIMIPVSQGTQSDKTEAFAKPKSRFGEPFKQEEEIATSQHLTVRESGSDST